MYLNTIISSYVYLCFDNRKSETHLRDKMGIEFMSFQLFFVTWSTFMSYTCGHFVKKNKKYYNDTSVVTEMKAAIVLLCM